MTNRLQKIEKAIKNMSDEKFNELLNDLGVKEEQWVPEYGERYYYVATSGFILDTFWNNDDFDRHILLMNNVFKTEEEAIAQRDFNIEKAKLIKEIEDSSDVIDWEDDNQIKYFLSYEVIDEELYVTKYWAYRNQGATFTTNKEFLENLIKNEPERLKKYLFGLGERKMKKTIEEIRDYLLENRVDEYGDLDLTGLDFSDFDGDVHIGEMKVKRDLIQNMQDVQGNLFQGIQRVQGDLHQGFHEVQGDYFSKGIEVKGDIEFNEPTKMLKKITLDELKEMGYELMEDY